MAGSESIYAVALLYLTVSHSTARLYMQRIICGKYLETTILRNLSLAS
jgi:hypothetical protein